ncbi:MAG: cytochrome [Sphingomonas bacterium]|nr:cytochrome [Sphingomonas bacterium]
MATMIADAETIPLADIDVSDPELHRRDTALDYLKRLRREDPVHYCANSAFGPYWSLTKFNDIMNTELNYKAFTSEGTVVIDDQYFSGGHIENEAKKPNFIVMDPPVHTSRRSAVAPGLAPGNLAKLEQGIRERTQQLLDELPIGETVDWVDSVSIELTMRMLAILFGHPYEERRQLLRWSNIVIGFPGDGVVESWQHRSDVLKEIYHHFAKVFEQRLADPSGSDLISMLARSPVMNNLSPEEFLGTITLLLTGGNETTRNSMSGSILAMKQFPGELAKLRANPALVPSMVSEVIRWQTPVNYMRRTATEDCTIGGKQIRKGERVVMWYLSGNRDEEMFDRPDEFIIDRPNPRQHLSFGFGVHRCLGNRLAEMQLRILWEEILPRFSRIEMVGDPVRVHSNMFRGFHSMPVRIHR